MTSTLRRLLSGTGGAEAQGHAPASAPLTPRLSTSVSINDFSMGTAADAAELDAPSNIIPSPAAALGRDGRRSLDSLTSSGRSSLDAATFNVATLPTGAGPPSGADVRAVLWRASTGCIPPGYGPTQTPAINIPPPSAASTRAAMAAAAFASGGGMTPAVAGGLSPPAGPTTPLAAGPAGVAAPATTPARPPAGRASRTSKAGNIDGLDYYEYVELIRASSL